MRKIGIALLLGAAMFFLGCAPNDTAGQIKVSCTGVVNAQSGRLSDIALEGYPQWTQSTSMYIAVYIILPPVLAVKTTATRPQ